MRNGRINFIFSVLIILGAAIISRLFFLQIIKGKLYQAQALGQQATFQEIEGNRGQIFFKDKAKILALNDDKWAVYLSLNEITDKIETIKSLSAVIKESEQQISAKIEKSASSYVLIKNKIGETEAENIKKLKLNGIYLEKQPSRYYPQNGLGAKIVGFVGGNKIGQYGLEGYYDEILKGKKSIKEGYKNFLFFDFKDDNSLNLDGADLYLTIDYNIQFEAENLLKEAKKNFDIDAGQIMVMEPLSGKIIAMADFPSFNPNEYGKEKNIGIFENNSIQKTFELGSVLKPVTAAIALNEGLITPETSFVDEGFVKIGGQIIYNFDKKKYGKQTVTNIIEKSINTGAVFISQFIPQKTYLEYLDKFGFGEKTGIDLQGEIFSQNKNLQEGREINFATASFGQGIEITPIQLITAYCVFANGGKLVKPYVVEKIVNNKKEEIETRSRLVREVINPDTASQITKILVSTVENGTAKQAKVPGYYVAGKTGTAQVAWTALGIKKEGYHPTQTIHSFVGYAPALNPKFVILIKLDNPKIGYSGTTAAPIFSKLSQYILNYWQIPPDYN